MPIASPSRRVKHPRTRGHGDLHRAFQREAGVELSGYGPRPQSSGILSNCYRKLGQSPVAGVGALDGHVERLGWRNRDGAGTSGRSPRTWPGRAGRPVRSPGQTGRLGDLVRHLRTRSTASSTGLATKRREAVPAYRRANQQIAADQRASGHLDAAFLSDLSSAVCSSSSPGS